MSLLLLSKKSFRAACLLMTDYTEIIRQYVGVKELCGLMKDYYFSELEFENELYKISYAGAIQTLMDLLENCTNPAVLHWVHLATSLVKTHNWFSANEYETRILLHHALYIPSSNICTRVWCWNRPGLQCICGCPLNDEYFKANSLNTLMD